MKTVSELQSGDEVMVMNRYNAARAKVISVGPKYIVIQKYTCDKSKRERYNKKTLLFNYRGTDYDFMKLFLGDKSEYKIYKEKRDECKKIRNEILNLLTIELGKEKLTKILKFVQNENNE